MREKLTGKLLTLDRALEGSLPALLSLLDVPTDDPQWTALDPSQRRRRTLDAVKRLLLRESQVQPLLVVFEDLHWIDSETQALLDGLVESLPTARVLLLVNYRPEYSAPVGRQDLLHPAPARPLAARTAPRSSSARCSGRRQPRSAQARVDRADRGQPVLPGGERAVARRDRVAGRGAWRLPAGDPCRAIQVPATVQAVLAARIDRLPPEDKRLLQTASVVGKDVPFGTAPGDRRAARDEHCRRGLGRPAAAEFLYETRIFPDVEYTFKHALTHDVTYGGLLQDRRRRLHAPDRGGDRAALSRPARRARRAAGPPRVSGARSGRRR